MHPYLSALWLIYHLVVGHVEDVLASNGDEQVIGREPHLLGQTALRHLDRWSSWNQAGHTRTGKAKTNYKISDSGML